MVRGAFFILESCAMPRTIEDHDTHDEPTPSHAPNGANFGLPLRAAYAPPMLPEEDNESPADRVFALLEGVRDEERAQVKLFRVTGPNRYEWCADYPVQEFEEGGFGMVREVWGPGEYEIRLYATSAESGKFVVRAKPRISIAPDPRAARAVNPAPAVSPELTAMMKGMQETQAAMLQALTNRPAPPDPLSQMQNIIAIMGAMRQAMGPVGDAPKSQISEIMGAIKEIRAVADEINPKPSADSGDDDNPMKLLPGIIDLVGKFAPGQAQQSGANAAPVAPYFPPVEMPETFTVSMPTPATAVLSSGVKQPEARPHTQPETEPGNDDMNPLAILQLRGYLKSLVLMAQANKPTSEGAQLIYEKIPDAMIELMALPTWFDLLSQVAPETVPHRAWLTAARDEALKLFDSDDDAPAAG